MALDCEGLVEGHLDALHGLAQAWTHDPELARELVQRTFLRAFENLDQLRDPRAARSWLITIFRRELAGECRGRARVEPWDPCVLETLPGEAPEEGDLEAEQLERLPRLLEALPETSRRILLLRFQQELSYEAMAQVLEVPVGTVMSRLHRAKAALRDLLQPQPLGEERA